MYNLIALCVSPGPYFTAQVDQQKTRRAKSRWSLSTFLFERQEKSIWRNTAHGRKPSWNGPRLKTQRSRGRRGRATQSASPKRPRVTLAWKARGARLKYKKNPTMGGYPRPLLALLLLVTVVSGFDVPSVVRQASRRSFVGLSTSALVGILKPSEARFRRSDRRRSLPAPCKAKILCPRF